MTFDFSNPLHTENLARIFTEQNAILTWCNLTNLHGFCDPSLLYATLLKLPDISRDCIITYSQLCPRNYDVLRTRFSIGLAEYFANTGLVHASKSDEIKTPPIERRLEKLAAKRSLPGFEASNDPFSDDSVGAARLRGDRDKKPFLIRNLTQLNAPTARDTASTSVLETIQPDTQPTISQSAFNLTINLKGITKTVFKSVMLSILGVKNINETETRVLFFAISKNKEVYIAKNMDDLKIKSALVVGRIHLNELGELDFMTCYGAENAKSIAFVERTLSEAGIDAWGKYKERLPARKDALAHPSSALSTPGNSLFSQRHLTIEEIINRIKQEHLRNPTLPGLEARADSLIPVSSKSVGSAKIMSREEYCLHMTLPRSGPMAFKPKTDEYGNIIIEKKLGCLVDADENLWRYSKGFDVGKGYVAGHWDVIITDATRTRLIAYNRKIKNYNKKHPITPRNIFFFRPDRNGNGFYVNVVAENETNLEFKRGPGFAHH